SDVGYIDANDWMDYPVNVTSAGSYNVSFRIASGATGGQMQLRNSSGSVLATVTIPATGGWQTWQTVTTTANLTAGAQTLRLHAITGGYNVNWVQFANASSGGAAIPGTIQAESYSGMSGIQTEGTSDAGGGLNVGFIDANDWMDYNVNVASAGSYAVGFRVASGTQGGQMQIRNSSGTVLATINVPGTGGWQTWTTVSTTVNLPAGSQTLRVYVVNSTSFNFNWMQFSIGSTGLAFTSSDSKLLLNDGTSNDASLKNTNSLLVFPNPVTDGKLNIQSAVLSGEVKIEISDISGKIVLKENVMTENGNIILELPNLLPGLYIIRVSNKGKVLFNKVLIK
ncbi:MAG: hypothetical protein JWQ25_531, partial [Daejeonella sp.]|nr:hypothetical protein [Daejeonella sp.]